MAVGAQAALPPGTTVGGQYKLCDLVGEGGFGAVYRASGPDGSECAVKLPSNPGGNPYDDEQLTRFLREARAAACVTHRNTARVLDAGTDAARAVPYLVMELLEGEDLDQVLQRVGVLSPIVAVRVILQACRGLAAAHAVGLIHRDVKPSNLFLHRAPGGEVIVKVCDFGLAKWAVGGDELTRSGALMGTPLFASPEQLADAKRVDLRSDIWSLGMTLYKALSGRTAYENVKSYPELLLAQRANPIPELQDIAPWVDPGLAQVVHGALLSEVAARCPSADELAAALEPYAGDTEHLNTSMLERPPQSLLSARAPRVPLPTTWDEAATSKMRAKAAQQDTRLGTTINGRWHLLGVIGRGGMGVVYEAEDKAGARCALKVILRDDDLRDSEAARRFVREGRALMAIDSPNVVRVLDVDTDPVQRLPYLAMELLTGTDLAAHLRADGALQARPIVRVFVQVCSGLSAAHATGVIHRDIKPGNIFLHEADGLIVPKVCDFGVAKRVRGLDGDDSTTDLTRTGGILGSPMYMSPEQARNAKRVDQRTDIWSLGVALWEALSGERAWQGCSTVGELILAICTQDIRPLAKVAPWVDPGLAAAVHKALRKEASERYLTASEFAAALEPYALAEPAVQTGGLCRASRAPAPSALVISGHPQQVTSTIAHASTLGSAAGASARRPRARWLLAGGVFSAAAMVVGLAVLSARHDAVTAEPPAAVLQSGSGELPHPAAPAQSPTMAIVEQPSATARPEPSSVAPAPEPGDAAKLAAAPKTTRADSALSVRDAGVAQPEASAPAPPPTRSAVESVPKPVDSW